MALRGDLPQQIIEHGHHAKQAVVGNGDGVVPVRVPVGTRNLGPDAKGAVPKASVMGAEVTNLVEGCQPRVQHTVGNAILRAFTISDGDNFVLNEGMD
jgi:hypothetical protein